MKEIDEYPEYKMHPFFKMMPRPLRKFVFRYCNTTVMLILGVIIFLIIIPVLTQRNLNINPYGMNNITKLDGRYITLIKHKTSNLLQPLTISFRKNVLESFTPYKRNSDDKCINRTVYNIELSRYLGLNPYEEDLSIERFLIVGNESDIGYKVSKLVQNPLQIGCQNFIDFASSDVSKILNTVKITHAVVNCPIEMMTYSEANYIRGISRFFKINDIKFAFVLDNIPSDEISKVITDYKGQVIIKPQIVSDKGLLTEALSDCLRSHHTEITIPSDETQITDLLDTQIANFVLNQINSTNNREPLIVIEGDNLMSLKKAIKMYANADDKCSISYSFSNMRDSQTNLKYKMVHLEGTQNPLSKIEVPDITYFVNETYMSFVVVFENQTSRALKLLNNIANHVSNYKIRDFEVILVGTTKFENIPLEIQGHATQILYNQPLTLTEAKNIGIHRSKGRFVCVIDANTQLRDLFFHAISMHDFNPYFLYKSVITQELKDYKFKLMRHIAHYENERFGDGFYLASRTFWNAVGGFPELGEYDSDNILVAKAMKLIPGYGIYNLDKFISMQESYVRKFNFIDKSEVYVQDFFCYGESKSLSKLYDIFKWGHPYDEFDEIIL